MSEKKSGPDWKNIEPSAANGLFDRRAFFKGGAAFAATMTGYTLSDSANAQQLIDDPWSAAPGTPTGPYESPSRFESGVARTMTNPNGEPRGQQSRTPHHLLDGSFTPNGLHMVISRSGAPDIDPEQHRLVIHGLVRQPLTFTLDALARYPMVSRMAFVECGGNSAAMWSPEPLDVGVQQIHGLVSSAEWTGVMLSTLLEETGIDPSAKWLIAEGSDALTPHRSVPIAKALDDAMIALYQNGERIMPGNGYPMRLLLPGWEGNMQVKWLRRIELVDQPAMSIYEARTYTQLLPGGKAYRFHFLQEVKSFITRPSPGVGSKHSQASMRSRVLPIPPPDGSRRSWSRPTAVRAGRRPHWRGRYSRRRSPASARPGNGTAAPLYCRVAPGTSPVTSSPRGSRLSPVAARRRACRTRMPSLTSTTTARRAGPSIPTAR